MSDLSRDQRINEAFVTMADTLVAGYDITDLLHNLVEVCVDVLGVTAGGMLLADDDGNLQLVASTSQGAEFVEVMQHDAGAGPCVDSYTTGTAVAVPDLKLAGDRWPEVLAAMQSQGFTSVYAIPMRLRGDVIGAMNLFSADVAALDAADTALAQSLADVATIGILQERNMRESTVVSEQLQRALESRVLIEQAKGVLSALGPMSVDKAFEVLRAYARSNNLNLRVVAGGVIDGSLDLLGHRALVPLPPRTR